MVTVLLVTVLLVTVLLVTVLLVTVLLVTVLLVTVLLVTVLLIWYSRRLDRLENISPAISDEILPVVSSSDGITSFSHFAIKSLGVQTPLTWKYRENTDPVKLNPDREKPRGFPSVNLNCIDKIVYNV